jgi:outer membrane protein TolC
MKLKISLFAIIFFTGLGIAFEKNSLTETLDLDKALDLALKNNSELLIAEQNMIIAQSRVREATFRFFPQIGFAGTITKSDLNYPVIFSESFANHYLAPSSYENFYTLKTTVVQTLYSGGKIKNTLRLAKTGLKQAQTEYEKIKRQAELNLKKAFFELLYEREILSVTKQWYEKITGFAEKARLNSWQKIQAEKLKQELIFDVDFAQKEIKHKKLCLMRALNKDPSSSVEITGQFEPDIMELEPDKAVFWAMEMRSELKSQVYKAEMDEISLNLAMSRKAPTISLGAVYDLVGNKFPLDKNSWYTTLAIQFPLSLDLWTQIKQRRAEIRQGELKRASMQDEIRLEVRRAYNDMVFWQKKISQIQNLYQRLNTIFTNTSKSSPVTIDTLNSAKAIYEAQMEYLLAVKNQLVGRAQMEWVLGCKIPCHQ